MTDRCHELERQLHSYLDRELSEGDMQAVRDHLDDCPPCLDKFELQADLKRLVKVHCQKTAPARLRDFVAGLWRR